MKKAILVSAIVLMATAGVQAAFIVEAHSSGKANANFTGTGSNSTKSTAIGCTASNSLFLTSAGSRDYVYKFTPGVDLDNTTLTAGTDLGNGDLASGLVSGTGIYNVYITWPASTNVNAAGAKLTITNDGTDVVIDMVNMNTGGTGNPGGNNAWLKIASNISLTAGTTYTVTQTALAASYVSMRSHGVMWEQQIPEPASLLLLGAGALAVRKFRKA
ncbi:MAG: PEP-CTERM sorting domain-containing protein [Phycisphaerae bacterium]|nr:PEP-CTERM sorting domain-containing protein [Phycisphaerae bacterium]